MIRDVHPGSRMFIPNPDFDFLPIPHPRVKKAPDPGSETATLINFKKPGFSLPREAESERNTSQ